MPAKKSSKTGAAKAMNKKAMKRTKGGLLPAVKVGFETMKVAPPLTPQINNEIHI